MMIRNQIYGLGRLCINNIDNMAEQKQAKSEPIVSNVENWNHPHVWLTDITIEIDQQLKTQHPTMCVCVLRN